MTRTQFEIDIFGMLELTNAAGKKLHNLLLLLEGLTPCLFEF